MSEPRTITLTCPPIPPGGTMNLAWTDDADLEIMRMAIPEDTAPSFVVEHILIGGDYLFVNPVPAAFFVGPRAHSNADLWHVSKTAECRAQLDRAAELTREQPEIALLLPFLTADLARAQEADREAESAAWERKRGAFPHPIYLRRGTQYAVEVRNTSDREASFSATLHCVSRAA